MPIKILVLGGGMLSGLGGGEGRFYFYGREDFSEKPGVSLLLGTLTESKQTKTKNYFGSSQTWFS